MGLRKSLILTVCAVILMSGCTNKEAPLPTLVQVNHPIPVDTVWLKHINASSKVNLTKYTPVIDGSQLFTSDEKGNVSSIQLATGATNWHIKLKPGVSGGVEVGGSLVYVPTQNGEVYALNEENGNVRWHTVLPNQSNTAPTYAGARLYVKTIDDKVLALNTSTGQILWTYDQGATQLQLLGSSRVAVSGNTVIAGFSDGKVNALNANTGQLMWQTTAAVPQGFSDVAQMVGVFSDPIISGTTVFVGTYHGSVAALDIDSGTIKWQHNFSTYDNIAVTDAGVFAASTGGHIVGLNRANGTVMWKQDALAKRRLSGIAVDGNNLVVGDDQGNLHWLSAQNGAFVARIVLGKTAIETTPLSVSSDVIVSTQNGNVFVLRLAIPPRN
ncbi:MAG: outer membrane protein assembly factor BamB [Legionellales bacterium]|nr:outer membrane protein assembly factor BamB [Legionellales bacterium]